MTIYKATGYALSAFVLLSVTAVTYAKDQIYTGFFSNRAVDGYDVVAYFTEGKPVKGKSSFNYDFKGAEWLFSSQANLEKFKENPEAFAPQYGGYCAWAVSQGKTASAEPDLWKIVDGKLYLNYNDEIQARWERDIPGFIQQANKNWPAVLD